MADRSLFIEIVVDDKGAVTKLAQLDGALKQTSNSGKVAGSGLTEFEKSVTKATAAGVFLAEWAYDFARNALSSVVGGMKAAVSTASAFQNTFIGLSTVAKAFGQDIDGTRAAAVQLASDGLMTVQEAAAGLKNLLSAGFGLPEAIQLMTGFKDIAAFNRQASLEFGYAVVSATEGIKNQNSILVDNAGLTKNLSVIMKEAGLEMGDLARVSSDAGVKQKFLSGLMKEMQFATGDAARMADTYSGSVARMNTNASLLRAEIGERLMPVFKLGATIFSGLISVVRQAPLVFLGAATAATALTTAAVGYGAWVIYGDTLLKVGAALKTLALQAGLAEVSFKGLWIAATGPVGLVTAGIGAVVLALTGLVSWSANARLAQETAAAKADAMARASKIAGKEVTDYAKAVAILKEHAEKAASAQGQAELAARKYGQAVAATGLAIRADSKANNMIREADERYWREIGQLGPETLKKIQTSIQNNTIGAKEWSEQLALIGVTISEGSIKRFIDQLEATADAQKEAREAGEKATKKLQEQAEAYMEVARAAQAARQAQLDAATASAAQFLPQDRFGLNWQSPIIAAQGGNRAGHDLARARLAGLMGGPAAIKNQNVSAGVLPFNFADFMSKNLGDTVMDALTGGGSVLKSVGGLFGQGFGAQMSQKFGGAISGLFGQSGLGKMLGNTLGNMLPGIGALAGPLLGKLGGWIGGMFSGGEGAKTNDARDEWMKKFGESTLGKGATKGEAEAELNRLAIQAGVTEEELRKLYSTKKVEDFQKRAEEVTRKIEAQEAVLKKYGVTWTDFKGPELTRRLNDEVKKLTGEYDALIRAGLDHETAVKKVGPAYVDLAIAAVKAGQEIPAALAPTILELAKMGQLTEAQAQALLGLAADSGPSFQQMEQAAQKYGIALDDLGARYHQLKVNDMAEQMAADFKLLTEGGAPVREVLAGMADEVNKMVQEAIKYGAKIPESMRPVLEKMIEQGQLTDANGNKFTDLSKIDFATPIKSSTELLIEKMTELIDKISGVAGELRDIPTNVDTTVTVRRRYVDEDRGDDRYHSGGYVRRAHTGLAIDEVPIIAQTGEGIINRDGMRRIGRSGLHTLNNGGSMGGDVAAALVRLAQAIEDRPVEVSIDGEVLAAAHTKAVRRRVGPARKF